MSGDTTVFRNREPLPSLSLSIGSYERKSIVLDSLTFELYHFPGHDFFMRDYMSMKDSVEFLLEEPVSMMREIKGGDYPFRKFTLVETPVNFVPRQRKGFTGSQFVQPDTTLPTSISWLTTRSDALPEIATLTPEALSICAAKVPVLPVASGTVVVASVVDWVYR